MQTNVAGSPRLPAPAPRNAAMRSRHLPKDRPKQWASPSHHLLGPRPCGIYLPTAVCGRNSVRRPCRTPAYPHLRTRCTGELSDHVPVRGYPIHIIRSHALSPRVPVTHKATAEYYILLKRTPALVITKSEREPWGWSISTNSELTQVSSGGVVPSEWKRSAKPIFLFGEEDRESRAVWQS